jgi:hypothetical protein
MHEVSPLPDLESAELAFGRILAEVDALDASDLSPMNVDVVNATSIALGVAARVLTYRERMVKLPEFDIRKVDNLVDYAKAAWYVYVTNLPAPEPSASTALIAEVAELRAKLLLWAGPLVASGKFDEAAISRIRDGSGNKDVPSDLVALVGHYRASWDAVKNMCGVTEDDLDRGAAIGPAVFALISRRENEGGPSASEASLRVRRAWTLLDRAYAQCRRALQFLRFDEGDADVIAPSLRRNSGGARASSARRGQTDPQGGGAPPKS